MNDASVIHGEALSTLRSLHSGAADAIVTSPPYLDARPEYPSPSKREFRAIFRELHRVSNAGPFALNVGRLWREKRELLWWMELLETANQAGWQLVDTLVWVKPNANPIQGQILTNSHEYVFLFGDPGRFNSDAVRTPYAPGSIERTQRRWVSSISVKGDGGSRSGQRREDRRGERREPNPDGARAKSFVVIATGRERGNPHPAPMPVELARHLVKLCSREGETVLDPFAGSGTTALAARHLQRRSLSIEMNGDYAAIAESRLAQQPLPFEGTDAA